MNWILKAVLFFVGVIALGIALAGMYDIARERFITGGSAITAGPAIN